MSAEDVRWMQRFAHFRRATNRLKEADKLAEARALSDLEQQGMIKGFELTYELAWNVLKDYLEWQGTTGLYGSRTVIRTAFNVGLISDGEAWIDMVEDRNLSSHVYDEETAKRIVLMIHTTYLPLLEGLEYRMQVVQEEEIAEAKADD